MSEIITVGLDPRVHSGHWLLYHARIDGRGARRLYLEPHRLSYWHLAQLGAGRCAGDHPVARRAGALLGL